MMIMAVVLCCVSCSTIKKTSQVAPVATPVQTITMAELDIQPVKSELTYSWGWNPFRCVSVENVKGNLRAEILKQTNADVLVEPNYIVRKGGLFRGGSVTVIGYPATFKNFRTATNEDAELLRSIPCTAPTKEKKHFLFF